MATKTSPSATPGGVTFSEFDTPSMEQWHEEVVRLLKGAPFDKKMLTQTHEGITLQPLYTEADLEDLPHIESMPGEEPFVRGTKPLGYVNQSWLVAQELPYPTYEEFNEALHHDLERGQNCVHLRLDKGTQAGKDPDHPASAVGHDGTSIASVVGLGKALEGIKLEELPIIVQPGSAALPFAALIVALMRQRDETVSMLRGSLGMDPLCGLLENRNLPLSLERAYDEIATLTQWAEKNAPKVKTISVYGHPYADAGASAVQELAFVLATAVEYLRQMTSRGLDIDTIATRFFFGFSVGSNFFMEIAKLRAARMLWDRIVEASGGNDDGRKMCIHARTTRYNKTKWDPYVNMLRSTTEAFAAVMGGADSLHVAPFDEPLGLPSEFSRRIARNTQIILREEAHFDDVIDAVGGSWYIEKLTAEVAQASWKLFQEVEALGGAQKALMDGELQKRVHETAVKRASHYALRQDVMIGINKYPNPTEQQLEYRVPDYSAIYEKRAATLQELRTSSEHASQIQVLEKLNAIFEKHGEEAFEAVVDAAMHGATIGEFTSTLRHDADPTPRIPALKIRRAAEPFEQLRERVTEWRKGQKTPQIAIAGLGPVGSYMPRLDFTRSFYQVGGFDIFADEGHDTIDETVKAIKDSDASVAVIVSTDDRYTSDGVALAKALKSLPNIRKLVLAGMPKEIVDDLKAAGVDEFIHVRSDVLVSLNALADTLGVTQ